MPAKITLYDYKREIYRYRLQFFNLFPRPDEPCIDPDNCTYALDNKPFRNRSNYVCQNCRSKSEWEHRSYCYQHTEANPDADKAISLPDTWYEKTITFQYDSRWTDDELQTAFYQLQQEVLTSVRSSRMRKSQPTVAIDDYIRNDRNHIEYPFETWERCLRAYESYKLDGKKILLDRARNLGYQVGKNSYKPFFDQSALNRYRDDVRTAMVFIQRAGNGTFPYGNCGRWEYREQMKEISLKEG